MPTHRLVAGRAACPTVEQMSQIEDAALRILSEVGIAVPDDEMRGEIAALGFRVDDGRVLIDPDRAAAFIEAEREANGNAFTPEPREVDADPGPIVLYASPYPQLVHDLESDRLVPFTTERLIEATRLVDVLADRGVGSSPPGCPTDVPAVLQPVVQYWVGATHSRHGRRPVDAKSLPAFPYVMDMAEVLGHPVRYLPAYVSSPLTLGGEALRCAHALRDRIESVHVVSMPTAGGTAPVHLGDAFALAAAETMGSALLLREVLELPVGWNVAVFPVDFAGMALVFGSPEYLLMQWMGAEVGAYFHGTAWPAASGTALTMAKMPGPQACTERSVALTAGALMGQRRFEGAGTLSLDEVFSAEQLLYDLEVRDHVQALVDGLTADCDPARCVDEVREALRQGSFMVLESTVEHCRDFWPPALFERGFAQAWRAKGSPSVRAQTKAMVRSLIARHDHRLEPGLQREIDAMLARAKAELA